MKGNGRPRSAIFPSAERPRSPWTPPKHKINLEHDVPALIGLRINIESIERPDCYWDGSALCRIEELMQQDKTNDCLATHGPVVADSV